MQNSYAEKIRSTLAMMNISNPEEIMERYPFELSGGLCQRVVNCNGSYMSARVNYCRRTNNGIGCNNTS